VIALACVQSEVDVWHTSAEGFYENQDPPLELHTAMNSSPRKFQNTPLSVTAIELETAKRTAFFYPWRPEPRPVIVACNT
jgi:hypothetical protein